MAHCHVYEITNSAESKNAEDTGMFLVVSQLNPIAMDKFSVEAKGYHIFMVNMNPGCCVNFRDVFIIFGESLFLPFL